MELDVGMLTMHSWNFCRMKTVICACASSGTAQIMHLLRSCLSKKHDCKYRYVIGDIEFNDLNIHTYIEF